MRNATSQCTVYNVVTDKSKSIYIYIGDSYGLKSIKKKQGSHLKRIG